MPINISVERFLIKTKFRCYNCKPIALILKEKILVANLLKIGLLQFNELDIEPFDNHNLDELNPISNSFDHFFCIEINWNEIHSLFYSHNIEPLRFFSEY